MPISGDTPIKTRVGAVEQRKQTEVVVHNSALLRAIKHKTETLMGMHDEDGVDNKKN